MIPTLVADIAALPGWNTPMLLLLAKATLILIAALGVTIAMQRASAGARHLVWLVTLGTLMIVPALAAWSPLRIEILPATAPSTIDLATDPKPAPAVVPNLPAENANVTSPSVSAAAPISITTSDTGIDGVTLLLGIWAAVVLLIAGWLGYGALVVRRIVRNAHPLDTRDWVTPLWEIADRLGLEEPPRLLGSDEAKMPFACGFMNPTIVLPSDCETWSADRRRAVLLHELAHVRRHDLVGHTLGRMACAVYWFHPLVWTAARRLRNESERACDDLALSCGARASDYAEHLLDIVTSVRGDSTPAVALAMARRKEFEGRMLAILDPQLRHSSPNRKETAALVASLALIAIVVGAAAPAPRTAVENTASHAAASTPAIDKDFTPQDVDDPETSEKPARPAKDNESDGIVDEEVEKSVASQTGKFLGSEIGTVIGKEVAKVVGKSLSVAAPAVAEAVAEADAKSIAAIAMNRIAPKAGETVAQGTRDDRPGLLANILRTESDASLRKIAAWGLSEYASVQVAEDALATALRRDSDAAVREMAAWSLSNCDDGSSTAEAALSAALKSDASERVRSIAAWSLGRMEGDAVGALTAALSDPSRSVRVRAVWALGSVEPREAPRPLIAMLRDSDPAIRELTAWALYRIEDPGAVPALQAALQAETKPDLRIAYIKALASMGEKSVDAIRGLLTSPDPRIKSIAIRALAGGDAAGPWPWPWPEPRPFP